MMNISENLAQCSLFSGLSPRSLQAIASVAKLQNLAKREILFNEGQKAHSIFLLKAGSIKLLKTSLDGREVVIKTVNPGEIFAEATLFERDTYPVTAIAVAGSTLAVLPRQGIQALLEERLFRNEFIASLIGRIRYLADRLLHFTTSDVEDRFFTFLEDHGGRKYEYTLPMSKKEIAAAMGATPETFSRLMLRLKKEKKLTLKGKTMRLKPGFWQNRG
ncbi:MAG: hypothetical protein C0404_08225 [Verrucomicrobia bacterium]|nr:hypothetical protein [Verrucomicrobiota bacterium]